jgi:hypothetical protein
MKLKEGFVLAPCMLSPLPWIGSDPLRERRRNGGRLFTA